MGRQVLISTKESFRQGSEWEYLSVKKKNSVSLVRESKLSIWEYRERPIAI